MSLDPTKNFAKVQVNQGYASGATSIALVSGDGAKLPNPSVDGAFNLVWWDFTDYPDPADDPNKEIVRCTARSTDTLTVTRGQESTSDVNHNTANKTYKMVLALTKKMIDDIGTNKQDALGYTAENSVNKKTTLADNSDTYYPSQKCVKTAVDAKISSISQDTAPQLGGALDLNSKNLVFVLEPGADDTAEGFIATVTVDTNTNGIGSPLTLAADGHFDDADADSSANCGAVVLALETGTGSKKVLFMGIIRHDAWAWTLGAGKANLIYLSTTAGTLTQTQPSGTDDVVQPVGWALTDDCIFFNPSLEYFTHT